MFTFGKSRAEIQLVASQKTASRAQEEMETTRKDKAEQIRCLRALRHAKEAADKKA